MVPNRRRARPGRPAGPRLWLAWILPVVLVAACGGDDDPGSRSDGSPDRSEAGDGGEADVGGEIGEGSGLATIADALAAVPSAGSEDVDELVWGDLEQAAGIAGVEAPDDPGDRDAVAAYLDALEGFPVDRGVHPLLPEAANPRSGSLGIPVFAGELGWSLLDVDRFVERRTSPNSLAVFEGDFDQGELGEALGEPEDGIWAVASPPSQQQWGDPLALRLDGARLSVSQGVGSLDAVRDLGSGGGSSLADEPRLVALAGALDDHDPYAAMLARPGPRLDPQTATGEPCDALPEPVEAAGVAIAADDEGPLIVVALAHAAGDAASANAVALPDIVATGSLGLDPHPLRDLYRLEGVDTTGDVVAARLRPSPDPSLGAVASWWDLLLRPSPLVAHC